MVHVSSCDFIGALSRSFFISLSLSERVQKLRRELQQARAAPAYEELEVIRRRALDYDPPRVSVRTCACACALGHIMHLCGCLNVWVWT